MKQPMSANAAGLATFEDELRQAFVGLRNQPDHQAITQMAAHWTMVKQWNKRVNLTAIRNDQEAAWLHYRDSLEAQDLLPPGDMIDIGTGAGFPGVPLAIVEPQRQVVLLDPLRKRCSFLEAAKTRLGLGNACVRQQRADQQPEAVFAVATTRATFSKAADILACLAWVRPGGCLLAYGASCGRQVSQHAYELLGRSRTIQVIIREG